ncbi:hypothetical protein [uncultured Gammaproteobacteria bacterium]|nr:hypothetical protein [uncultured Gammaproteobacteria bacterium]CAC9576881.1 hypothetical protein [uncultured Gammaproteobacteria bacterium]CAC9580712.1 hypothetical protein [uncultured Gammaproteobacteria bacterium]
MSSLGFGVIIYACGKIDNSIIIHSKNGIINKKIGRGEN